MIKRNLIERVVESIKYLSVILKTFSENK